ncbi:hypothetical protein PFICI_04465 [Pestalotiopsis fici W106-1]|uniref:PH domain-containing protein n=1 Tax=Pestalotiopsis fici (strain W106-1 / CGMCC3.15140) TaxID=1229662 RepID=W3X979_PESFW|nr:uncharacterized protein PFICI_04465 [Pestalotiopsis fici W106-1]ETS82589.1 hypothetical protein PFICI_04465 [Pestalotiopsis fici W106-1]
MEVDSFAERPLSPSIGMFESLKSRPSSSLRRARPPNIVICDENKTPLRPDPRAEKSAKRESKVGLRSIFGRTKSTKTRNGHVDDVDDSTAPNEAAKSGSTKASFADRHWPYSLQASRSDLTLASMPSLFSSKSNGSSLGLHRRAHEGSSSSKLSSGASSPPADAWNPPPLFQVYPQAIMHDTLPACAASAEALAKLNASHNVLTKEEPIPEEGSEKKEEKPKKLHQRHAGARGALEWTTKTYALVTSGYLLQYAADGHHDRSPEKILRLSKDSAAFASDLIPGKHWVLQVVACMDTSSDSRSFISKLALRGTERKFVSTMLMVFERAEDMDGWLAVLRKEIVELGGKKQLTETGEVKSVDVDAQLKTKNSQRTIVVRDPSRFSTMGSQDFSGLADDEVQEHDHGLPMIPTSDFNPDLSMDNGSFTESHCSSDGQRLESLRDSRESNTRFSYISSSQRTHGTTANSSPSCSPTRTSFSSKRGDSKSSQGGQTNQTEIRLRPNSQAISMRRQSVQAVMASFDAQPNYESRPGSSATTNDESNHTSARQSIPNFSKRLSTSSAGSQTTPADTQVTPLSVLVPLVIEPEPTKSCRKPPPTFGASRPLSTVMDLPSPRSPLSPSFPPANAMLDAPDSPAMFSGWAQREAVPQAQAKHLSPAESRLAAKRLSSSPVPSDARTAPRRFGSLTNLRAAAEDATESTNEHPRFILSSSVASRREQFELTTRNSKEAPRSSSALGAYGSDEVSSEKPLSKAPSYKRSTMMADNAFRQACPLRAKMEATPKTKASKPSSPRERPRSPKSRSPSHSPQHLDVDIQAKGLGVRRSMPQLCVGPPLLPPPNRALPPIPQKD